ncbi:hypothetical protein ACH5RR_041494 [Cinchona calisaya]|uniref:Endonuclease/exonuclease/phosphatase n=1 Tax=Cinchona calisaya TaxID=153742 RepID=A0ABD2XTT8_9GENT
MESMPSKMGEDKPFWTPKFPMRVMVWNCQGVGSPLTVPQLNENVLLLFQDIIFLCEMKNKKVLDTVKKKINFEKTFVVDANRRAGGMAAFWNSSIPIKSILATSFTIELEIEDNARGFNWWLVGLYASSENSIRKQQWNVLQRRKVLWVDHWILAGTLMTLGAIRRNREEGSGISSLSTISITSSTTTIWLK